MVRRAGAPDAAGQSRHDRRLRRRDGGHARAGHGSPLRREHLGGAPGDRLRKDAEEPGGKACSAAHAPRQGTPSGAGAGPDLAASGMPSQGDRRPADRCPQPRARGRGVRHAVAPFGAGRSTSLRFGVGNNRRGNRAGAQWQDRRRGPWRRALPRARQRGDGARVAGAKRCIPRAAISFTTPRGTGRGARPEPDPAHLQGDGKAGRAGGGGGRQAVRAQHSRGRGAGHDRVRHRATGDPPGGTLEEHGHGEPLRRAAARAPKRRGAAQLARMQSRE